MVSLSRRRRQAAQRRRRSGSPVGDTAVHVGQVDVGEADGAAVGQVAGRRHRLGDRAGDIGRRRTGASLVPVMVTSICRLISRAVRRRRA